jgi:hypothetical protein
VTSSLNILRLTKSRRMRWAGHVASAAYDKWVQNSDLGVCRLEELSNREVFIKMNRESDGRVRSPGKGSYQLGNRLTGPMRAAGEGVWSVVTADGNWTRERMRFQIQNSISSLHGTGWHSGNAADAYSGGAHFRSRQGHRRIFAVFQSLYANAGIVPRLIHDHFLPNPLHYIICSPTIRRCMVLLLTASL